MGRRRRIRSGRRRGSQTAVGGGPEHDPHHRSGAPAGPSPIGARVRCGKGTGLEGTDRTGPGVAGGVAGHVDRPEAGAAGGIRGRVPAGLRGSPGRAGPLGHGVGRDSRRPRSDGRHRRRAGCGQDPPVRGVGPLVHRRRWRGSVRAVRPGRHVPIPTFRRGAAPLRRARLAAGAAERRVRGRAGPGGAADPSRHPGPPAAAGRRLRHPEVPPVRSGRGMAGLPGPRGPRPVSHRRCHLGDRAHPRPAAPRGRPLGRFAGLLRPHLPDPRRVNRSPERPGRRPPQRTGRHDQPDRTHQGGRGAGPPGVARGPVARPGPGRRRDGGVASERREPVLRGGAVRQPAGPGVDREGGARVVGDRRGPGHGHPTRGGRRGPTAAAGPPAGDPDPALGRLGVRRHVRRLRRPPGVRVGGGARDGRPRRSGGGRIDPQRGRRLIRVRPRTGSGRDRRRARPTAPGGAARSHRQGHRAAPRRPVSTSRRAVSSQALRRRPHLRRSGRGRSGTRRCAAPAGIRSFRLPRGRAVLQASPGVDGPDDRPGRRDPGRPGRQSRGGPAAGRGSGRPGQPARRRPAGRGPGGRGAVRSGRAGR